MDNIIDFKSYYEDMCKLAIVLKANANEFDCIVCLKRSGFILGSFLSNQLTKPLFTTSEINSIPENYKNILIIDDKICTGKSINRVKRRIVTKIY